MSASVLCPVLGGLKSRNIFADIYIRVNRKRESVTGRDQRPTQKLHSRRGLTRRQNNRINLLLEEIEDRHRRDSQVQIVGPQIQICAERTDTEETG